MPWKKSKVPSWKRKGAGKKAHRRRKGYRTIALAGTLNPIPQRMIVKHKYATSVSVSTAGAPYGQYQFNLNSMYDPDRTGGGHQPYGRDTYASLYNRYRVISVSYRVAAISGNAARVIQVAVVPTNQSTIIPLNMAEAREFPRCKYVIQQPGAPQQYVSGFVSIPSLMGRTKAQYMADDAYQAQSSASPTELAILNLFAGAITDDLLSETMYFNVEMEFTTEWFDVNTLQQS